MSNKKTQLNTQLPKNSWNKEEVQHLICDCFRELFGEEGAIRDLDDVNRWVKKNLK